MANKQLNAVITIGGAVSGSLKSALGTTTGKLQQIGQAVGKLKDRQKELNRVIAEQEKLGRAGSALKASYAQTELGVINKQIDALRKKGDLLRRELDISNKLKAAREKFANEARSRATTAVAIGATVAYPTFALLKESAKFDYQLQLIGNTADMTKGQVAELGKVIMEASKTTGQSATTLQSALGFLVAAGMDVNTSKEMIRTIGRAATAAGADIEDMSKAAFVLNDSLKIAPKDMVAALDTLAQAGKEGNVELKDMAKVLPVLGSGMVAMKMQGREAAATMGAALEIARKGAPTADAAATNMENFFNKVMSPETLKKGKKNFGLDLYSIITKAQKTGKNPFEASMTAIMKATKGDQKAIGDLFQDMQVQNFIRPLMQNWDEYQRIKTKALGATGVTDRDFDKVMATSQKQLDQLSGSFERIRISIGEAIQPAFGRIAATLEPVLGRIEKFIADNKELVGTAAVVVGSLAAVGTAVFALGAAVAGIGSIATAAAGGLMLLVSPWALIGAAAVAAGTLIYKNWDSIVEKMKSLIEGFKQTVLDAFNAVGAVVGAIGSKIGNITGFHPFSGGAPAANTSTFGGERAPALSAPPVRTPPPVPSGAKVGKQAAASNTFNQTFNIHQQPGESQKGLAERIVQTMKDRERAEKRNRMYDPVIAGAY